MIKATKTISIHQTIFNLLQCHISTMDRHIKEHEALDRETQNPDDEFKRLSSFEAGHNRGFLQCLYGEQMFLTAIFSAFNILNLNSPLETKFFEVRDHATCMPAIGIKMSRKGRNEAEQFLMGNAGYAPDEVSNVCVLLVFIGINQCHYDPYAWRDRTKEVSHKHIYENFDDLESGSVVDVRFILGETKEPTKSDRFWEPGDE